MSKPGQPPFDLVPARQVASLLEVYRPSIHSQTVDRLASRVRELGLAFTADELCLLAALDTPERVQEFLNTQVYYNNDHAHPDQEETAMSPRQVLQTVRAHCFEGALFAYAVNYLHGHNPRLVLLEASQDSEHNLVLFTDSNTGLLGCNAHSAFPHLDGRPAVYNTLRALAESYVPWYYSDRSMDPNDLTLVGYSEPFDLVRKFGVGWMSSDQPLWDIYYTYIDDTITLHYLFDDSAETHLYPLVRALRDKWIQVDSHGQPFVSVESLPVQAQPVWHAFWQVYDESKVRPREIEKQFMQLTGTTPLDLTDNAWDFVYFLERGYRVEQILTLRHAKQ